MAFKIMVNFVILFGGMTAAWCETASSNPNGHLYLINDVIESTAHLRKGEKIIWYGAIPADVVAHGVGGFIVGGPWGAAAMAGGNALHVVPSIMATEYARLQLEASYRAQQIVEQFSQIPNNKVLATLSLAGGTVEQSGLFVVQIKQKAVYFLNLAEPLPDNYSIQIPNGDGTLKSVSFIPVVNPEAVTFRFQIKNPKAEGAPWVSSLQALSTGIRLENSMQQEWSKIYDLDPDNTRIELVMQLGEQKIELGSFTEGHGVKGFLGRGVLGRLSYYTRRVLFGRDVSEGKRLRLKEKQNRDDLPLPPVMP